MMDFSVTRGTRDRGIPSQCLLGPPKVPPFAASSGPALFISLREGFSTESSTHLPLCG